MILNLVKFGISSFVFYLVCDMVLMDYSGVIESLNFLNFYFYNWNCIWVIQVILGNIFNVLFLYFQVEIYIFCNYDYLQVSFGSLNIVLSYCLEFLKFFLDRREYLKYYLK